MWIKCSFKLQAGQRGEMAHTLDRMICVFPLLTANYFLKFIFMSFQWFISSELYAWNPDALMHFISFHWPITELMLQWHLKISLKPPTLPPPPQSAKREAKLSSKLLSLWSQQQSSHGLPWVQGFTQWPCNKHNHFCHFVSLPRLFACNAVCNFHVLVFKHFM